MTFTEVRDLGYEYLMLHGLTELGWRFGFNDHKRTLGMCYYRKKRIEVSQTLVRSKNMEQIRETILHEIAHALVGPGKGHGPEWKAMVVKVGAQPKACAESGLIPQSERGAIARAECSCGVPHFRYRKPRNPARQVYCTKAGIKAGFLVYKPISEKR